MYTLIACVMLAKQNDLTKSGLAEKLFSRFKSNVLITQREAKKNC